MSRCPHGRAEFPKNGVGYIILFGFLLRLSTYLGIHKSDKYNILTTKCWYIYDNSLQRLVFEIETDFVLCEANA